MYLQVLLEVRTRRKLLVAILALKRFFTRMNSLMPYKVANLTKCLVTAIMVALVRLLLVVDASMLLQGRILGEGLITLGTKI